MVARYFLKNLVTLNWTCGPEATGRTRTADAPWVGARRTVVAAAGMVTSVMRVCGCDFGMDGQRITGFVCNSGPQALRRQFRERVGRCLFQEVGCCHRLSLHCVLACVRTGERSELECRLRLAQSDPPVWFVKLPASGLAHTARA